MTFGDTKNVSCQNLVIFKSKEISIAPKSHSNSTFLQTPTILMAKPSPSHWETLVILMKCKHERLHHTKSGSPAKRQRLLASLSLCVHQVTMNIQRSNPFHRSSLQEQRDELGSRVYGNRMPMDMTAMDSSTSHNQGFMFAPSMGILPSYHPGHHTESVPAPESRFSDPRFNNMHHFLPQTPSPRSWNLTSPPKPRRLASTAKPFPVPQSSSSYPVQARHASPQVPRNINMSTNMAVYYQVVGDPSLRIFRVRLPPHLLHLLDPIVLGCEAHASTLPEGWLTELYSLTKQDIALRKAPHLYDAAKPITSYIKRSIMALLGVHSIKMDRNQPHVLKYSKDSGHTGVELHHDKCDVTANLCLSRSSSYVGGG